MTLRALYQQFGAALAPDGIPLHFGDLRGEYRAALDAAILLDRSHEARFAALGRDRFALPQRMSTNDLLNMAEGEGRPTIFTNPNGRILERAVIYNQPDRALFIGEPGRGAALQSYLQRNIFFNDDLALTDLGAATVQFDLHGPGADQILESLASGVTACPPLFGTAVTLASVEVFAARNTVLTGVHWVLVAPRESAVQVWQTLMEHGQHYGLRPSGGLIYNVLRIRAGRPGMGRELTQEYIPLEVGLWDEVSFKKGCYTGQEILARMESRGRLAKTLVKLELDTFVEAPATLYDQQREVGKLTSSVLSPENQIFALGILKTRFAHIGQKLSVNMGSASAQVTALAGTQPETLLPEELAEAE